MTEYTDIALSDENTKSQENITTPDIETSSQLALTLSSDDNEIFQETATQIVPISRLCVLSCNNVCRRIFKILLSPHPKNPETSGVFSYSGSFQLPKISQDTNQKLTVVATLCMELYRILMGSLLLSFVPQKCGDHICGITENLYVDGAYYIVYIINIMTFISFIFLYMVEIKRENRLITYLDVSNTKPTDAISVAENLRKLPDNKRENILYIDKIYQQVGCFTIAVYVFNTIASGIVIYDSYLDNKTTTAFFTNILFMGTKVGEVYSIANTENNIFFSAYLKHKVQYNDVDPDKISDIEFGMIPENEPGAE